MSQHTDIAATRGVLSTLLADDKKDAALELMLSLVSQLKADNERLNARLARLLQHRFGRRSEKVRIEQLKLFLAEPEPSEAPVEKLVPVPAHTRRRSKHGRKPLPADLPRELVALEPSDEDKICAQCGTAKTCIGQETSEVLELNRAEFFGAQFV